MPSLKRYSVDDYTVGWVSAIHEELVSALALLGERHAPLTKQSPSDHNTYVLGEIAGHNVVLTVMPSGGYGIASAATTVSHMLRTFHNIRYGLMVGIGGGAPSPTHDIRLGDVVVSEPFKNVHGGVIQYDFGKVRQGLPFEQSRFLNQSPRILQTAIASLKAKHALEGHNYEEVVNNVLAKNPRLALGGYTRPDPSMDKLYKSEVSYREAGDSTHPEILVERPPRRPPSHSVVHYGLIASGDKVVKDALFRDQLAQKDDVLCFEMEAAGLMNDFPCVVIRGICDYADSHKNDDWQPYAAMIAAAYAHDLLGTIAPAGLGNATESRKDYRQEAQTATESFDAAFGSEQTHTGRPSHFTSSGSCDDWDEEGMYQVVSDALYILFAARRPLDLAELNEVACVASTLRCQRWPFAQMDNRSFWLLLKSVCGNLIDADLDRINLAAVSIPNIVQGHVPPGLLPWKADQSQGGQDVTAFASQLMARSCVRYLNRARVTGAFYAYASMNWVFHFRQGSFHLHSDRHTVREAWQLCDSAAHHSAPWFNICWRTIEDTDPPTNFSTLAVASLFGLTAVVEYIFDKFPALKPSLITSKGPLFAAWQGHLDVVRLFQRKGSRIQDIRSHVGLTALDYAESNHHFAVVKYLEETGVKRAKDL